MLLARAAVSLGLVAYLAWIVDWERAAIAIRRADALLLLASPICWLAGLVAASGRWRLVLRRSEVALSWRQACAGYLIGSFYNIFLPGVIGGDAVRVAWCARETKCSIGAAASAVLLERACGVLALLMVAVLVFVLCPAQVAPLASGDLVWWFTFALVAGAAGLAGALWGGRWWLGRLRRDCPGAGGGFLDTMAQALPAMSAGALGRALLLSALFQASDVVATFLIARAVELTVPLAVFFAAVPLVYLATVLPLSLGGLGVREGTLVFLLSHYGVLASDAVMLSLLVYLGRVAIGAAGGIAQLAAVVSLRPPGGVSGSTSGAGGFKP